MEKEHCVYSTIESEDTETIYIMPINTYVKSMFSMGWYVSTSGLPSGSWEIKYYTTT